MDTNVEKRQYGLWSSPVSAASLAQGKRFSDVAWDRDGSLAWLESRSSRGVIVIQPADGSAVRDLNSEFSVRARVGYGGGDFSIGFGHVYFVDADSGRIYRQPVKHGTAHPVTPAFGGAAAPVLSADGKWLAFIHTYEGQDSLGVVDAEGKKWPQKLVSGDDFYMQPVWHPDGDRIAWISWNHPSMPWDGTQLSMGSLALPEDGLPRIQAVEPIAGGDQISIFQPEFSPDGTWLAYVSDERGWWQIYAYNLITGRHIQLTREPAEHGLPAWIQGMRTYGFSPDGASIFFLRYQNGMTGLWSYNLETGDTGPIPVDKLYAHLAQIRVSPHGIGLIASGSQTPARVITVPLPNFEITEASIRARSSSEDLPPEELSSAGMVTWQGLDGGTAYGLYFPPNNPRFESAGIPPLIVHVHGGPTSHVDSGFNAQAQFFTSRGYAFLEVNHRGSTGHGREYRNKLRGNWGIYDVQDSVSGVNSLVEKGLVDGSRAVIMGGSAGGFTVLKAMEDYPGFFKAGICLYGVSDQFSLAMDTHKFEKHYTDSLLGPLPDAADIYRERSPVFFADKIVDAIALFQGEDDNVVPRNQSDVVVESLRRRGVPHIYHVYPGEGHGFRKIETLEHFYQAVEAFLMKYVIFA